SKANNFLEPADLDRLIASRREPPRRPRPRLAVVGRLVPEKGVLELVDELSELTDSWSEALVAGDAQDRTYAAEIEARIDALGLGGRLRLRGHRDDVPELPARAYVPVPPLSGPDAA